MRFPARADICSKSHFECFDLLNFLQASSRREGHASRWRCPICNIPLSVRNLRLCKLTLDLLDHINRLYPTICDFDATIEEQMKEIEFAYFDTTIFGKLALEIPVEQMEITELSQYSN